MPKIIIGNVDNDSMIGDLTKMDARLKGITSTIANRLLWLSTEEDIVLLPFPVTGQILKHISDIKGNCVLPERIVIAGDVETAPNIITSELLLRSDVIKNVACLMEGHKDWEVISYYHTSAVSAFSDALGLPTDTSIQFLAEGGAELFNSKSFFRKIMVAAGLPAAKGTVCVSLSQALLAAGNLIEKTGSIILKEQFNGGGDGNAVITYNGGPKQLGASRVFQVENQIALMECVKSIWPSLTSGRNSEVVIESYYNTKKVIYSEFQISATGRVHHLNHGVMRMEPQWCGFEIPGDLTGLETAKFIAYSQHLALIARDTGYVGKINFDAIVTDGNEIIFSEFNGRLGGCTHIDVLAQTVFGDRYLDNRQIVTRNKIPCTSWSHVLDAFNAGYVFDENKGEGVIVLTDSIPLQGTIEIMAVGASLPRALDLEAGFLSTLAAGKHIAKTEENAAVA